MSFLLFDMVFTNVLVNFCVLVYVSLIFSFDVMQTMLASHQFVNAH